MVARLELQWLLVCVVLTCAHQSYFLSMGITSPVTRQTAGALFHQQLALQLADFLAPRLEHARGVMTLPDTYCLFNRARGTELVSPEDLIKVRSALASAFVRCICHEVTHAASAHRRARFGKSCMSGCASGASTAGCWLCSRSP